MTKGIIRLSFKIDSIFFFSLNVGVLNLLVALSELGFFICSLSTEKTSQDKTDNMFTNSLAIHE